MSLNWRLKNQLRIAESVSHAVDGLDVLRASSLWAKLATQVRHVGINRSVESVEVVAEYPIDDLVPGKRAARLADEQASGFETRSA